MRTVFSRMWSTAARRAAPGIWPLLAVACLAPALGLSAAGRGGPRADLVRLQSVAGQATDDGTAVLIETSEPVPYVASDPDPATILVDLRNATSDGVRNQFRGGGDTVASVAVEDTTAFDGAAIARVRISLAAPLAHRVRSTRNVIRVEVDAPAERRSPTIVYEVPPEPSESMQSTGRPATLKPATRLRALRALQGPRGPMVVLEGNGALSPANVQLIKEAPCRLVLDFSGVMPGVKGSTPVDSGPVNRVRVALHSNTPPVTRVVVDLSEPVPYRLDESEGGLAIVFETARGAAAAASVEPASPPSAPRAGGSPAAVAAPAATTPAVVPATKPADASSNADLLRRVRALQAQAARSEGQPVEAAPASAPAATATPAATSVPPPAAAPPRSAPAATPSSVPAATTPAVPAAATSPAAAAPPAAPARSARTIPAPAAAQPAAEPSRAAVQPPAEQPRAAEQQAPPPTTPPSQREAQPTPSGQSQIAAPAAKQFTGAPLSLDFAGADIRQVLRVFSEVSGLNIIIDPKVSATVDVALRDVPWDQALEIILRSAGLGYVIEGNVVRIAPLGTLADEEAQRRKLADERALSGELDTLTRTLSYATAKDIKNTLERSALTKRGSVQVDDRTNTLIVRDLRAAMPTVTAILDALDRPQPQVEIEARIIQTTRNFARQLGIQWGFSGHVDPTLGNATGLAFPNSGSITGATGATQGANNTPSMINMRIPGAPTSAIGLALGSVNGAFNLDIALSALESSGQGRILSTPRVIAQNNYAASILQGVEIPIQTVANNTVTVQFKPAALQLKVTPQITAAGTVILTVNVENASPDYTKQVNNIPPINTQRAETQVLVKDNDTLVIGGVYVSQEQMQKDRTPGLHRIPLLGWLFRRDIIDDQANELLIFITPRIIKG